MHRKVGLIALIITVATVGASFASAGASERRADAADVTSLTRAGRTVWQFEALLFDTFHRRDLAAHYSRSRGSWNFGCAGECAPLSNWSPYRFTFAEARSSSFHVSQRQIPSGAFGNYPLIIKIKGHTVACDQSGRKFLITYGDAVGLWLNCMLLRR
jgi:hypothetical protein